MARALSAFVEFTSCMCHLRASCDISTVWTEHQFLMSVHESVLIRYRWKAPDCSGIAVAAVPLVFCGILFSHLFFLFAASYNLGLALEPYAKLAFLCGFPTYEVFYV